MVKNLKQKFRHILKIVGSHIQIDALYIARGGFWTSAEFAFSSLLSLGLVIAFANFLPKETYGIYKYIMSLAGSLAFLTFTGMNTAVVQAVAKGHDGALPYAVRIQLRWNALFSLAALLVSGYYLWQDNTTIAYSMAVLAITFPLSTTFNTYGAFLAGKKDFKTGSFYGALSSAFYTIGIFTALFFFRTVFALVIAYALGNLLPMIYFYLRTLERFKPKPLAQGEKGELLTYGGHLSVVNILSTLSQYVDKIVVFHFLGAVELAVYGLALAIPERIRGYNKTITGIILPKLAGKDVGDIKPVFYKRTVQAMLLGAAMSFGYILVGPFVFKFLLPKYLESIQYSQIISLGFIFTLPATYMSSVFRSQKMIRTIYLSSTLAHFLRIVLYVTLGPIWGLWGIIWATLLVYALGLIYNFFLWEIEMNKHLNFPFDTEKNKEPLSESPTEDSL